MENNQEGRISLRELLAITLGDLERIMVPGGLLEQIGMPLNRAIHNIRVGIEAIDRESAKETGQTEAIMEENENADIDV